MRKFLFTAALLVPFTIVSAVQQHRFMFFFSMSLLCLYAGNQLLRRVSTHMMYDSLKYWQDLSIASTGIGVVDQKPRSSVRVFYRWRGFSSWQRYVGGVLFFVGGCLFAVALTIGLFEITGLFT